MTDVYKRIADLSPQQRALLLQYLGKQPTSSNSEILPLPDRMQPSPLSFAQQRLWFLDQLEPGCTTYLIRDAYSLRGVLSTTALEYSLEQVIQRHESLRTTFCLQNDLLVQVIHPSNKNYLLMIDLQSLTREEREIEVARLARQEGQQPFHLEQGPLLRVSLLRLGFQEHVILLTIHHIISDGWSMQIFYQEFAQFYQAYIDRKPISLPLLPIQYADFAIWQRQWLQSGILEAQLRYWKKQLAGFTPLKLLTDQPSGAIKSRQGATYKFLLPSDLFQALTVLSHQEGVTLFMLLLATFQVLLYRWSGQEDIAVGTDVAGRRRVEVEGLIGFFINQLVLRANLAGNPSFRDFLKQIKRIALEAYVHQDLPFEKLVEALRLEQKFRDAPLFRVKLLLQNASSEIADREKTLSLPGITTSPLPLALDRVEIDLILNFSQMPEGLLGTFIYRSDLFSAATIVKMASHFITLLESICADLNTPLNALNILTKEEKEQRKMQQKERDSANFAAFKNLRPKMISLRQETLIQMSTLGENKSQPLVIRPEQSRLDLADWAKSNLPLIETRLLKHGAILFRDFDITTPTEFEHFASILCSDLFRENGEHIQAKDIGDGNLYTPVFYAPEKKLLWHNENSFNYRWPMKIMFYCSHPAPQGGETPIADSRKVFQLLHSSIREKFLQKGVMYVRNYGEGLGLPWQIVFRTTNKAEVESYCRRESIAFEWRDNDLLRTHQIRPAMARHPQTGEWLWWSQLTHWHPSCLDPSVYAALGTLFSEEELPRQCFYGDGTHIEDAVVQAICAAYQGAEISFPWQRGDILVLDNMLTAHARNPYRGQRTIYVSMGGMITIKDI